MRQSPEHENRHPASLVDENNKVPSEAKKPDSAMLAPLQIDSIHARPSAFGLQPILDGVNSKVTQEPA